MVTAKEVKDQLKRIGYRGGLLGKAELEELPKILLPEEQLTQVVMGWHKGGLALLCATNQRVLLIDKKLFFLTLEDVRYDLIAEVMYQYRLLDATIVLSYAPKSLQFRCWNQGKLRQLASYVQQRVMEKRTSDLPEPLQMVSFPSSTLSYSQGVAAFNSRVPQYFYPYPSVQLPQTDRPQLPVNPYQSKLPFRRRKVSRFVTSSQMTP